MCCEILVYPLTPSLCEEWPVLYGIFSPSYSSLPTSKNRSKILSFCRKNRLPHFSMFSSPLYINRKPERQRSVQLNMAMSQEGACDISLSLELSIGRSWRSAKECSEPCFTFSLSDSFGASDVGFSVKKETVSRDIACEEVEAERLPSFRSGGSDEDDDVGARKKLRLTKEQSALLENRFKEHSTINTRQKHALAEQLSLRPRQIEVWFQNRRARTKLKQMEVDCEFLKKRCQKLSDENRRLHKELQQIKTPIKATPSHMSFPAAVNLTVCPSCESRGHSAGNDQD
ncbi:homeobox-leucine zipper protein HOX15-like [Zingiber officinale]|uniref:Homeobox domain-containing protein n=1 Tax=Zingiber officinale TaxID=94328 RepID=A0A8J5EP30_ZINOF|nr:homeobox-leucine zipper protein HOX15-like [Zingiber officinale]KAG6470895.1 hypothetical protein ZIOFF_071975 [Zingiber officinale]